MKKLGILIRPENTEKENNGYFKIANKNHLEIIFLNAKDDQDTFYRNCKLCDGFLLTGGNKKDWYDDFIIEYALKKRLPLLGICQGMQSMAIYKSENDTVKIGNNSHHLQKEKRHLVLLQKGRLQEIVGQDKILVNSYHYETVESSTIFSITGYSEDGLIEVVENKDHPFQIGLQWHPERMMESKISKKIIKRFVEVIKDC